MYEVKTFDIPALEGISEKTIKEHLGLYAGYVKHVNLIHEKIAELKENSEKNAFALSEVQRRLGFEFGGMRNHEYYFEQFVGGAKALPEGPLAALIRRQFDSQENFVAHVTGIALTRGVGWAMVYIDKKTDQLVATWVDEQHLGHLADLDIILGIDMWEHSYLFDYVPSEKKKYIEACFNNLNWEVVADRVAVQ